MDALVISLDCVRPEALSCYPESFSFRHRAPYRAETPNIDALAADGQRFRNAFCQAPFTPASHASLFTGQNPYRHGIRGMFNYELNDTETMAERFSAAGYDTGGFIGAHALSSQYGLDRGFDEYDEDFDVAAENWVVGNRRPCTEVTSQALDWLDEHDREFLLFVHYFDAHDGGETPVDEGESGDGDELGGVRGLYDSYLRSIDEAVGSPVKRSYRTLRKLDPDKRYGRRYHLKQVQRIDEQIGRLVERLRDCGQYEQTTIVLLADHGDAFGEHGEYGHRKYIYDTTIRVPLIIKPAADVDLPRGFYDSVVRTIDVYPTLADEAGIDPGEIDGTSLYTALTGNGDDRKAYAETRFEDSPEKLDELVTDLVGIRSDRWKFTRDQTDGSSELYDVTKDRDERENVADEYPDVRADLSGELDALLSDAPTKEDDLTTDHEHETVKEHLRGLGYLS